MQQGRTGIQTLVTISNFYYNDLNSRIFFTSNWYTFAFICTGELNFGSYIIDVIFSVNLGGKNQISF